MNIILGGNSSGAKQAINDVTLGLKDQQAILKNLQIEYAKLSTEQARGSAGKAIKADISIAREEIKRLSVDSSSAFGAIGSAATKGFSAVRQLAYVLPGIGIAGIFSLAAEAISTYVEMLVSNNGAINKTKALADVMGEAKKSFVEAYTTVDTLRTNIDLAKKGLISKTDVVKEYNETLGKTTGFVNSLSEAEAKLGANADAYIEFTLKKAVAQIAAGKAAEIAFKRAQLEIDTPSEAKGLGLLGETLKGNAAERSRQQYAQATARDYQIQLDELTKQSAVFEEIFKNAQNAAAVLSQRFGFKSFEGTLKAPKIETPKDDYKFNPGLKLNSVFNVEEFKRFQLENKAYRAQVQAELEKPYKVDLKVKLQPMGEGLEAFKKQLLEQIKVYEFFGNKIADIFTNAFDAISKGKNIFKSLGESIKQLVTDMIKLAIRTFIVQKILTLIVPGGALKGLTGLGGIGGFGGFFAQGGRPPLGKASIVGENGPELFIPDTAGKIVPNNSFGNYAGGAAQMIGIDGQLRVSGRDLVYVFTKEKTIQGING